MKRLYASIFLLFIAAASVAQKDSVKSVFAFPITDYMPEQNDSIVIVQVQLPDAYVVDIPKNQMGILKHRFQNGKELDTALIGFGRCSLVKGDYRYFGIALYPGQTASAGDLIYVSLTIPLAYKGELFNLSRHHIHLQMVDDGYIYHREDVYLFQNAAEENKILDSLVADIRYTGKVMIEQMPDQNQLMTEGLFKGKKLFVAMQQATRKDLITFLRYVHVRPQKYAGHSWKISEIFATWMVSGTPHVAE